MLLAAELVPVCEDNQSRVVTVLTKFNATHDTHSEFPNLSPEEKHEAFKQILQWLDMPFSSAKLQHQALQTIKILSREKKGLQILGTASAVATLMNFSGLKRFCNGEENVEVKYDQGVIQEAQKCLCNILFQVEGAREVCTINGCVEAIVQRMKTYKDPEMALMVKYYDMRMLFVITALVHSTRLRLITDLHGLTYLVEVLDLIITDCREMRRPINEAELNLGSEVLKTLFNITIPIDKHNLDEEEEAHFQRLASILHDLLLIDIEPSDRKHEVVMHCVNLLTNMPPASFDELYTPVSDSPLSNEEFAMNLSENLIEGKDMSALAVLVRYLEDCLESLSQDKDAKSREFISPVLSALSEICRANKLIRLFCRLRVLPHLGEEVKKLPTEGDSLRARLVQLFTSPTRELKELSADFCFVLCKENVHRFIKYTGYGNAAGLLAQRGLIPARLDDDSDSEDSETEEYRQLKPLVNPATGRWEEKKKNLALEGMTEEQKEFEVMQLVDQMNRLSRGGVVQPMTVADGRPRPITDMSEFFVHNSPEPRHGDQNQSD